MPAHEEEILILIHSIKRVHPKIVVVMTGARSQPVELTLALKPDVYHHLIKMVRTPDIQDKLPLVFTVDAQGYVKGWITYKRYKEIQEHQAQK